MEPGVSDGAADEVVEAAAVVEVVSGRVVEDVRLANDDSVSLEEVVVSLAEVKEAVVEMVGTVAVDDSTVEVLTDCEAVVPETLQVSIVLFARGVITDLLAGTLLREPNRP